MGKNAVLLVFYIRFTAFAFVCFAFGIHWSLPGTTRTSSFCGGFDLCTSLFQTGSQRSKILQRFAFKRGSIQGSIPLSCSSFVQSRCGYDHCSFCKKSKQKLSLETCFLRYPFGSLLLKYLFPGILLGGLFSFCLSILMLSVSIWNYPGGEAIQKLHEIHHTSHFFSPTECPFPTPVSVHMDTLSTMTGISRFAELEPCWIYSKVIRFQSLYFFLFRKKISLQKLYY